MPSAPAGTSRSRARMRARRPPRAWRGQASARSPVDLPENDVHRADHGDRVGDHVAARQLVERREVRKAWRADLEPIRLVGAVADDVNAELALRMLDRRVRLALGNADPFGIELEVVDEVFHAALHLEPGRR